MNVGDYVYPSSNNPHKFNKNTVFPFKVKKVEGYTVWLERSTNSGKKAVERWWIGFWQTWPLPEIKQKYKIVLTTVEQIKTTGDKPQ